MHSAGREGALSGMGGFQESPAFGCECQEGGLEPEFLYGMVKTGERRDHKSHGGTRLVRCAVIEAVLVG